MLGIKTHYDDICHNENVCGSTVNILHATVSWLNRSRSDPDVHIHSPGLNHVSDPDPDPDISK